MHPKAREFVEDLKWDQALDLLPRVNRTWVHECYANFPQDVPEQVDV